MRFVPKIVNMVKAPCQQRSRDSLERILKAAESVISSKGYEGLTIAEVVRRSHTSVGTVYQRFPDKVALLHAVYQRVKLCEMEAFKEKASEVDWDAMSLAETVHELSMIKRQLAEGRERLYEAFVVCGATDAVLRAEAYRYKGMSEDIETEIMLRHADEIGHEDVEEAVRTSIRLTQAAAEEHVQRFRSGVPGPGGVPQDILRQKLAQVIVAYLKNGTYNSVRNDNLP
jgi:AcrR family transcriptional regulator